MNQLLLVGVGGGLGSIARYVVSTEVLSRLGPGFPWGTLTVNVVGSFLLGLVLQASASTATVSPDARLFLTTGFMGGFTTYSTFNYETLRLLQEGSLALGLANVAGTLGSCLLAGGLGMALVRASVGGG